MHNALFFNSDKLKTLDYAKVNISMPTIKNCNMSEKLLDGTGMIFKPVMPNIFTCKLVTKTASIFM